MSYNSVLIFLIVILHAFTVFGQRTQQDTMYVYHTTQAVTIDGKADDACWQDAEWFAIDQVWIPYGASMKEGDFEGRFKMAWDSNYLYILAEIIDDSLSDNYSNPLQNWWDDDCLEVFIDEDRSKGDHERNYNAFAYHASLFYDVIDLHTNGNPINLKDNLMVLMDTLDNNIYIWELAIKMYSAEFNPNDTEASRVYLHHNKLMGFSLAYCDSDESTGRENFIGSMYMPQTRANDNYKTADFFGSLLLIDPSGQNVSVLVQQQPSIAIYPNPAVGFITIENAEHAQLEIVTMEGKLMRSSRITGAKALVDIDDLPSGVYLFSITTGEQRFYEVIVKKIIK